MCPLYRGSTVYYLWIKDNLYIKDSLQGPNVWGSTVNYLWIIKDSFQGDSIDDAMAPILGVQYQMTAHHLVVLMIA